jgi:hypothetical protein
MDLCLSIFVVHSLFHILSFMLYLDSISFFDPFLMQLL